ncbi:Type IV secretory pathway%2C VirB3-like protein [Yersinia aldovae]|uniref:VirB3 family type IV secretion system protein n=1 Tax=Yersinia aldovae TaxID=29483 RepID=UPI0005DAD30C|nr:VirB3 family type IV secretion system protein [Yersinia aldovae]CNK25799.1 Type IV secretory pathway%2C VirB3-like protein [Yersinia aldovae]
MNKDEDPVDEFATYNGLNRPALLWGIPLIPLVIGLFLIIIGGVLFFFLFGLYGLILPLSVAVVLLFLKAICELDPNALESYLWRFKGWLLRFKQKGDVFIFTSGNEGFKKKHAKRIFKRQQSRKY